MIGSFFTRGLVMMFGYAYPAYECFKVVEMNKPDIEQLRFWCQYWILVALLTVCERVGDAFVSWVPMYSEAKLAFFLYLWYPKTKGATYVYDCFFKPFISNHEAEIDRNLLELRVKAEDLAVSYSQRSVTYIQTRIFDILQYVASQSSPPGPSQAQQQAATVPQPAAALTRKPSFTKQQTDQPPSSTLGSSKDQQGREEAAGPSQPPAGESPAKTSSIQALIETARASKASEVEVMQIDSSSAPVEEIHKLTSSEIMEEGVRITRARSRTRTVATR
ncbi:membrane traffic protein [Lithospermum erythrorhizon]|uniref:HVA22-like protein n=1 Tax=Lithospermum erythrorhizon TaxID=34254 RepID=A0AAV3PN42_LITER